MADELIDIYDSDMNLLGTAMKSQAHTEGLWHKAFHCWIVDGGKVWLQLRGADKALYPNLLDISCAGHIGAGETAKQGGIRELEEELGLEVKETDFTKLFTYTLAEDVCGMCNREFCPTYALNSRWKLEDVMMQAEEVDGVYEAKISDLIALFGEDVKEISLSGIHRLRGKEAKTVGIEAFCPHGKNYYLKAFNTLERFAE